MEHINLVEESTNEAHLKTLEMFGDRTWVEDGDDSSVYSELAQQFFNNCYDEIYSNKQKKYDIQP